MTPSTTPQFLDRGSRARPALLLLLAFVVLLGLANILVVNQRVALYLFYIPVIVGAWYLPKRSAAGIALVAAALVVAYVFFIPNHIAAAAPSPIYKWAELAAWGGILVVTAWVIAALRAANARAMWNLQHAYQGVLEILSKFIQTVDTDTADHSVRVSAWSVRIAETLRLEHQTIEEARVAGLLHDVGKVEVSMGLLRKSASLSEAERTAMDRHAAGGAAMIGSVGDMLSHVADAVEAHHEKFDGSGARGLKGEAIPLVARIIAAADAFDAMISDRPYRKGMSVFEARDAILAASGTHFDPEVLAALKTIIDTDGEAAIAPAAYDSLALAAR
jgi:putative nucleotidyltransferase with HDIG domain